MGILCRVTSRLSDLAMKLLEILTRNIAFCCKVAHLPVGSVLTDVQQDLDLTKVGH